MHDAHAFLVNLAMVFGVAAVVTVVFHRLRLPVVLGYLLAGMFVGPHVDVVPLVADAGVVNALAELGVILLMFGIGLEFNLRKLVAVAPTGGLVALGEVSFSAWLGFQAGQLLGWTTAESLFTGAIVAISSTSIIAKAFEERQIGGAWKDVVFGILIVEDLLAIVLLVVLGLVSRGTAVDPAQIGAEVGKLGASLTALLAVGLVVVPRFFRYVVGSGRAETIVVSSMGLCFGVALLMQHLGYSVALGAFAAGMMVAESGHGHEVFEAVRPLRDAFTALFFVAVGMLIEPALVIANAPAVVVLVLVVFVGKLLGVGLGSFLLGNGTRTSVQAGMSMTQIGEFSFVIATLGTASGAVGEFLYPVAVAVSVVTTFTTPFAIQGADAVSRVIDHKLPKRLQIWTSLYTGWVAQMREQAAVRRSGSRRVLAGLVLDVALLGALAAAYGVYGAATAEVLAAASGLDAETAWIVVAAGVALLAAPLAIGIVRLAGTLADDLVEPLASKLSGTAPGAVRALSSGVRVAVTSLAGLVALALSMPWLPAWPAVAAFVLVEAFLVLILWRSAATMQGEVTPGAAVIARAILQGTASGRGGEPVRRPRGLLTIGPEDHAVGRTLVDLDVRARTGASIVAFQLPGEEPRPPSGREPLAVGLTLTIVGSDDAVSAAEALLRDGAGHPSPRPDGPEAVAV
jgi:CPA2 family monovalent cation:H+ antiporter-2